MDPSTTNPPKKTPHCDGSVGSSPISEGDPFPAPVSDTRSGVADSASPSIPFPFTPGQEAIANPCA